MSPILWRVASNHKFFPTVMIVLQVAAALRYLPCNTGGDWRKAAYWFAASVLTYSVTW